MIDDFDGIHLVVGIDYDTVTIGTDAVPGTIPLMQWRLTAEQVEELILLITTARSETS